MAFLAQKEELVKIQREIHRVGGLAAERLEIIARAVADANELAARSMMENPEAHTFPKQLHEKLLELLATQRPLATELRTLYAGSVMLDILYDILRLTEEVATHTVSIIGRGGMMRLQSELLRLFHVVTNMLRGCMESYVTKKPVPWRLVRNEYKNAQQIFVSMTKLIRELWADESLPAVAVNAMFIAQSLKWISERVLMLCHWVQFVLTGEWSEAAQRLDEDSLESYM